MFDQSIILKQQTSKQIAVPGDWVVIAKLQYPRTKPPILEVGFSE
jgi:hypothetical protein